MAETHDLTSIFSSSQFLLFNNGLQVSIDTLKGKKVGLYFSASWSGPCRNFTQTLVEVYNKLKSNNQDFEIIFISEDENEELFSKYFSNMPWLSIPFNDTEIRDKLDELFKLEEIPFLVILDENGKVLTDNGVEIIRDYETEGYPFTPKRIRFLKERDKMARKEQTLKSLLVSDSRHYVLSSNGKEVPISELEGKTVGLYFFLSSYITCINFYPILIEVYKKLKVENKFEIVSISLDEDEELFSQGFAIMPWYSLPFKDKKCVELARYFDLSTLPTLVIIGPDGKTLHSNAREMIEAYGIDAYPFTQERIQELVKREKTRQESQTLESILVSGKLDFVIDNKGTKVPVSQLVGKNILLYFSAHWCPPCRTFLLKLIEVYKQIKANNHDFEVIFISSDQDQISFEEFFTTMPWLAIPFNDNRKSYLSRLFKVFGVPKLVAIDKNGKTITTEARKLIMVHGVKSYPFTNERLREIEFEIEETARDWPEKVAHAFHEEHELVLTRRSVYRCDGCEKDGQLWSYYCEDCNFDLHPKCALPQENRTSYENYLEDHETSQSGWNCNELVCISEPM